MSHSAHIQREANESPRFGPSATWYHGRGSPTNVFERFVGPKRNGWNYNPTRDVHWSKFVGTGKERNAFPFKKDLSLSPFFRFFSFLERVFPLFPIFLGINHPILRHSFPVFSSFHLSKPVPDFLMGLKLAILERVLNENLSKPVPYRSWNRSSPFLKCFLVFPQPVFLSNKEKREPRTASVLKGYTLASV